MKTIIAIALVASLMAFVGVEIYSAIKETRAKKRPKEVKKDANPDSNN